MESDKLQLTSKKPTQARAAVRKAPKKAKNAKNATKATPAKEAKARQILLSAFHAAQYSHEADKDDPVCRTRRLHRIRQLRVKPQSPKLARRLAPGLPIR